ncbi:hypothetical protein LZZ85_22750 [Terrimonas sp. NA20]|uniref:Uncharacterized protein n=1 Tax=Terrimonas ginsenosidimutans TaxID=2908004 RepID=A0ABS9KXV9_9BACT|nr:hypothetical protein [Terrimonas ginsenosidimutans]MCG2617133.1 hypothetical protein [Terrimonas ginsenosidimutans]
MRVVIMLLLLDLYMVLLSSGQTGSWGSGIYSSKYADPQSATRQLGSLGILGEGGLIAGLEKHQGLPELDVY